MYKSDIVEVGDWDIITQVHFLVELFVYNNTYDLWCHYQIFPTMSI